jgi:hypothetical protein
MQKLAIMNGEMNNVKDTNVNTLDGTLDNNLADISIEFSCRMKKFGLFKKIHPGYESLYMQFLDSVHFNVEMAYADYLMLIIQKFRQFLTHVSICFNEIDLILIEDNNAYIAKVDKYLADVYNNGIPFNRCVRCFANIGNDNPRQLCGKTYCATAGQPE